MLTEKRLLAISPQPFTADGTANGIVTVADASIFRVRQIVTLRGTALNPLTLEVKRVLDANQLLVGQNVAGNDLLPYDISAYTVAAGSTIDSIEQQRPSIPQQNIERATYEDEPVVARRSVLVDKLGDLVSETNPLPIIDVGTPGDDWDDLVLTRDPVTQDLTTAVYKLAGVAKSTLTFVYDSNENLIEVIKT